MALDRLLLGHVLADRYRVTSILGRGGMGAVFHAEDTVLGRDVALKVMDLRGDTDAELFRARFRREARMAAQLQHPNVIIVHDFGVDAVLDVPFLVMELLHGCDLQALVAREGTQPPETVRRVLRQAADGLSAGHARGVIHRDVKPSNVFVAGPITSPDSRVVLLDFGIARMDSSSAQTQSMLTRMGQTPHSPGFASPEQLAGGALTPASDVFSLAATGWFLLTGESQAVRDEMLRGEAAPPPPSWAGDGTLREFLVRCLQPDPARRPRDGRAFMEDLDALERRGTVAPGQETRETVAHPASSTRPASKAPEWPAPVLEKRRVSPRLVSVLVALAVGATALLAVVRGRVGGGETEVGYPVAPPSVLPLETDTAPVPTEARQAESKSASRAFAQGNWTLSPRGVGPIRFGMTLEEAQRASGNAIRIIACRDGCCDAGLQGRNETGLVILNNRIQFIDTSDSSFVTPSGIQMGSTVRALRQAYAGRFTVELETVGDGGYEIQVFTVTPPDASDQQYRMVFEAGDGEEVFRIRAGLLPGVASPARCFFFR